MGLGEDDVVAGGGRAGEATGWKRRHHRLETRRDDTPDWAGFIGRVVSLDWAQTYANPAFSPR